jgi:hypothetical protein
VIVESDDASGRATRIERVNIADHLPAGPEDDDEQE